MYYFVANIQIINVDEYNKYVNKVDDVFSKYNGKYLALDDNPQLLEGDWNYTRSVIISFENEIDFDSWYNSKDYQEILKYRLNSAKCDTVLIKGNSR